MTGKIDEDILAFIAEGRELLEEAEPQVVALCGDSGGGYEEAVNLLFRAFHTIKGTAAFYNFENIVDITHKAETYLDFFRTGMLEIGKPEVDLFCKIFDSINILLEEISKTGKDLCDNVTFIDTKDALLSIINSLDELNKEEYEKPEVKEIKKKAPKNKKVTIGENIKIFISESRDAIKDIENDINSLKNSSDAASSSDREIKLQDVINVISIIYETSVFLNFVNLSNLIEETLKNPIFSELSGKSNFDKRLQIICNTIADIEKTFKSIEKTGKDFFDKNGDAVHSTFSNQEEFQANSIRVTPKMQSLFYEEAYEQFDNIEAILLKLKDDTNNLNLVNNLFRSLHSFKGSCGIMGHEHLEELAHKTESFLELVMDETIFLDDWDIRALWFVIGVMRKTVKEISEGGSGKILNIAVLIYMLEYISTFDSINEKDSEILLPEISRSADESKNEILLDDITKAEKINSDGFELERNNPVKDIKDSKNFVQKITKRKDIRVNLSRLDELINLIGELVLAENMVIKNPDIEGKEYENLERACLHLSKVIRELQDVALSVRMIPIAGVFRRMIRLVYDLSARSNKKVELKLVGEDTEIDKTVSELISDPLTHLVRNAIDHGILASNTGETDGVITLEARHEGGEVWISVGDNGQGLDREKILRKGILSGLVEGNGDGMTDREIFDLIFEPGFSTNDEITSISGRGVGMDVVKNNVEEINGSIDIYTEKGVGTTFVMRIPLTLAIIEGMLVRVGNSSLTIPLLSIRESIQIDPSWVTTTMAGQEMVRIREDLFPVIRLHEMYDIEPDSRDLDKGLLVIVEHQYEAVCLFIDEIIGEQQTVIKALSGYMKNIRGISGCTILGNGDVSLILDVGDIIRRVNSLEIME